MQAEITSMTMTIYRALEERIVAGVVAVGDCLPTETELAAEFNCGRHAVSQALNRLVHEGLVERRKRAGTRVIRDTLQRSGPSLDLDAVAFIYPSDQHEGIRRIGQGFQQAAHKVGRRVVTMTTGTDFHREGEIIAHLSDFHVKGAAVYPMLPEAKSRIHFAQVLQACPFPVVLTDITLPGFCCHSVTGDGFHAGYIMTRHLLAQGLRKIGFLANGAWVPSVPERYNGYRWALEEAGIEEQPGWALLEQEMHPNFEQPVEKCRSLAARFLTDSEDMEGVVCCDDFLAQSCLICSQELGRKVPDNFKIIGLGDYLPSNQHQLTTYSFPFEAIGYHAFNMLSSLIKGETSVESDMRLRGHLSIRQSA